MVPTCISGIEDAGIHGLREEIEAQACDRIGERGRQAVSALEAGWQQLRCVVPELPVVVITLVDATSRRARKQRHGSTSQLYGYFHPTSWHFNEKSRAHEVAVNPALFGHPSEVLHTLLHEAVHALNYERGCRDCNDNGYHRKEFRNTALQLGLTCAFSNCRHGWNITSWPDNGVPSCYQTALETLHLRLPPGTTDFICELPNDARGLIQVPTEKVEGNSDTPILTPKSGHLRLRCRCEDPRRSIYVCRSMHSQGGVTCTFCGEEFKSSTSESLTRSAP